MSPDSGVLSPVSPADLTDRVGDFPWSLAEVDRAVEAARAAQPRWEGLGLSDRLVVLRAFQRALAQEREAAATLMAREIGKALWDARTEVDAALRKVDLTIDEGLPLIAPRSPAAGLEWRWRPHGVLAVLGPFNFPLHLPNGHIVPALAAGNTVVFKPSDLAPATAALYVSLWAQAGLPPGVLGLCQGPAVAGAKLAAHPGVDGVLFTGSYAAGRAILAANLDQTGKILALELGGKNPALVLGDAPLEKAVHDIVLSANISTGQRCTAVSRVIVDRRVAAQFTDQLLARVRRIKVGHPLDPSVFMGPLAGERGYRKFLDCTARAPAEGAEPLLAPGPLEVGRRGYYVSPGVHRVVRRDPRSAYQREELFGPDVAIAEADGLEEACALAEDNPYGLAAAVFTADEATFEEAFRRLHYGVLHWNNPTVNTSSRLPFGGLKHSGNHRPAGIMSALYCAHPVGVVKGAPAVDLTRVPPGMA